MTQRTAHAWFNPALKPVGFYIEADPNTSIHLVATYQGQPLSLQILQCQFFGWFVVFFLNFNTQRELSRQKAKLLGATPAVGLMLSHKRSWGPTHCSLHAAGEPTLEQTTASLR